ncbi:MAG: hypothetical protein ACE5GN_04375, partial [Waddliaceae bacterium]
MISLRKTPGCRDRRPQGAIYADFFRRTRRQLWTDYGFALMGNASDYDILEFLKILHDSQSENVTKFCFKFQDER